MGDVRQVQVFGLGLSILLLGCAPSPSAVSSSPGSPAPSASATTPSVTMTRSQTEQAQSLPLSAQFEVSGQLIQLEVAQTPEQQATGLMFRQSLANDRGMLFLFEPARPVSFWMRNTLIPLDMVFLRDGEIKAIAAEVPPCTTPSCPTYPSGAAVNQVIELRSGRAAELGLAVGQQLTIQSVEP
jgi:uncharacterized protein